MKSPVKKTARRIIRAVADIRINADLERAVLSVFSTPLGWMGIVGQGEELISAHIGHPTAKSVLTAVSKVVKSFEQGDWEPKVRDLFEAYSEGDIVDFSNVPIRLPDMTDFRRKIVATTRRLQYGETISYGQLAKRVGHPGAARAVGTVMSTNRFPIIIPCHRVLASGGKIGGYSTPTGIELKRRILAMEARRVGKSSLEFEMDQ